MVWLEDFYALVIGLVAVHLFEFEASLLNWSPGPFVLFFAFLLRAVVILAFLCRCAGKGVSGDAGWS
jgi:hypothetical protein